MRETLDLAVSAMTNCPSEETLAAFLDGRLDPEDRRRVVEHLAECGDCRDLVLAAEELGVGEEVSAEAPVQTAAVVEIRPRTRLFWVPIGSAAAAAVVVLFLSPVLSPVREEIVFRWTGGLSEVRTAYEALPKRPIESRLVGFKHLTFSVSRGGGDNPDNSLENALLTDVENKIEQGKKRLSWKELHALALAKLLRGNRSEAAVLMEQAIQLGPDSPTLRNDLAAVYLERARWSSSAGDAQQALQASERAWALAQTPETAWNRALALKVAGQNEQAKRAWEQYLQLDDSPRWSEEARGKLFVLQSP
ncbi:MAG: zf-HC2 domain-containing protein [Acidobacteriota bacterium]